MEEKIFCPVNGWDCPYGCKDGSCSLGEDAIHDCDDYWFWFGDEEEEEE